MKKGGYYLAQRKSVRIEENLYSDILAIAEKQNMSVNQTIEQALKYYRDMRYMENSATFINEEILKVIKANSDLLLHQINNKSNQLLSELAIQSVIQNLIIAEELEVNDLMIKAYRSQAIEFLKTNNRVLRLDELVT